MTPDEGRRNDAEPNMHEQQQVDDMLTAIGECWSVTDYKGAQRVALRFLREIQADALSPDGRRPPESATAQSQAPPFVSGPYPVAHPLCGEGQQPERGLVPSVPNGGDSGILSSANLPRSIEGLEEGLIQQWRPIKTAPKDGTCVILWSPTAPRNCVPSHITAIASWCNRGGEFADFWPLYWMGWPNQDHPPTHWMPLPAPPLAESAREAVRPQDATEEAFIEAVKASGLELERLYELCRAGQDTRDAS